jgi:RNA polymerase sigma-70 factor (ECF subfamily)
MSPTVASIPKDLFLVDLIEQMAHGEQQALAALYDETSSAIHGLLRRMLERPADAEEALLDVYMKAWRNAPNYLPERGAVQPWLSMMARGIAIDRIRQRRSEPATATFEFENSVRFASTAASPEELIIDAQRYAGVHRVLNELSPAYRQVLLMAFFSGLTHSELAARLGQPLGTVKSRIRVGLTQLRDLLEEEIL